jgi:hypothetical protein
MGEWFLSRRDSTIVARHEVHRQSNSTNKGWIIGLDSPDFSTTAQLSLATGLRRFQCERLAVARTIHYIQNQGSNIIGPELFNRNTWRF